MVRWPQPRLQPILRRFLPRLKRGLWEKRARGQSVNGEVMKRVIGRDKERESTKEKIVIKVRASSVVSIERIKWQVSMERKGAIMPVAVVSVDETEYVPGK